MNQEKLESAKNLFFIALGLDIAVTALVVISDFWGAGVLKDIGAGRITADQSTISTMKFWDSFAKLMLLTMLGVGLGLVKWLNTCYSYAKESLGASGFKNEGWTAGGWIIPFINWFKPYQVINEIYKAGSPTYAVSDGWKKESGSGLLLAWWIFWSVTHFIAWIVGKQLIKFEMRDDMTLQQSIGAIEFHAWFCVVFLVVSGLWFVVANELTGRLLERQLAKGSSLLKRQPEIVSNQMTLSQQVSNSLQASSVSRAQNHPNGELIVGTFAAASASAHHPTIEAGSGDAVAVDKATEEDHWAIAMAEVESGQRRPGVWAKAFAESDGDETKAKAAYLKARVQQFQEKANVEKAMLAQEEANLAARERLQIIVAQFRRNALVSDADLKAVIDQVDHDTLKSMVVEATANTLLHVCVQRGLEREVHKLIAVGVNPEKRNKEGKTSVDIAPTVAVSLLLYGMALISESPNDEKFVDVPMSIAKIKAELAKQSYVIDGRTLKEPHGAKIRINSDFDLIEYARNKLQSDPIGKTDA